MSALRFISPCRPLPVKTMPVGEAWVHEVKFDGYRVQAHKAGSRCALQPQRVRLPQAVLLNPNAKLPSEPIVVMHRSDGSGTTFVSEGSLDYVPMPKNVVEMIKKEWAKIVGPDGKPVM